MEIIGVKLVETSAVLFIIIAVMAYITPSEDEKVPYWWSLIAFWLMVAIVLAAFSGIMLVLWS